MSFLQINAKERCVLMLDNTFSLLSVLFPDRFGGLFFYITAPIKQSNGLEFLYDHTGVFAVKYNNSTYFYRKNAQNDIIALLDNSGAVVVKYKYDAWGNCNTTVVNSNASTIANLNPFRYRSYYFDTEIGFYFLKTRYYDPEIGRFITIDDISYLDPESINGLNLYAYCLDNPVQYSDHSGQSATLAIILGIIAVVGLITTSIGVATDNNIVTAVGLTMVAVPALISGGLAVLATTTTLTTIIGYVTLAASIGTGLFASAEYQEAFTGSNWIHGLGIRGDLYNGIMLTFATIATMGTIASSIGYSAAKQPGVDFNPKYYSNLPQNDVNPYSVQYSRSRLDFKKVVSNFIKTIKNGSNQNPIPINRNGVINNGNHRVFIARILKRTINVIIKGMGY